MNIAHHMARAGHAYGERPAVAKGDAVLHTYASLAQRVERLAGGIAGGLGLAPGDRVALTMGNCPEYLEILYACWQAGLVVVPINAKLHASEFAYILENAGVRLCFATPDLAATVGSLGGLERCIAVPDPEYEALLTSEPLEVVPRGTRRYGLALLYQRDDGAAQRGHAYSSQPAGDVFLLLRRRGSGSAVERHHPCGAHEPRVRAL